MKKFRILKSYFESYFKNTCKRRLFIRRQNTHVPMSGFKFPIERFITRTINTLAHSYHERIPKPMDQDVQASGAPHSYEWRFDGQLHLIVFHVFTVRASLVSRCSYLFSQKIKSTSILFAE